MMQTLLRLTVRAHSTTNTSIDSSTSGVPLDDLDNLLVGKRRNAQQLIVILLPPRLELGIGNADKVQETLKVNVAGLELRIGVLEHLVGALLSHRPPLGAD